MFIWKDPSYTNQLQKTLRKRTVQSNHQTPTFLSFHWVMTGQKDGKRCSSTPANGWSLYGASTDCGSRWLVFMAKPFGFYSHWEWPFLMTKQTMRHFC